MSDYIKYMYREYLEGQMCIRDREDRAGRSLSHKKETARDASAHMQGDRADLMNMRDENAIGA